jgi:hypothetical protein
MMSDWGRPMGFSAAAAGIVDNINCVGPTTRCTRPPKIVGEARPRLRGSRAQPRSAPSLREGGALLSALRRVNAEPLGRPERTERLDPIRQPCGLAHTQEPRNAPRAAAWLDLC